MTKPLDDDGYAPYDSESLGPESMQRPNAATPKPPLMMVETAFLASAASLIWLINSYFPIGPLLRVLFPIPIALVYLRWGNRAAWMATLVSTLLLTVLMGPTRSVLFLMPFGFLGVLLGCCWVRKASWFTSINLGTLLGTIGLFFRFWLLSVLAGDDLWIYVTTQMRGWLEWLFLKLGLLIQPDLRLIQVTAIGLTFVNNLIYLFVVHIVAWWLFERLNRPIPQPPAWVKTLFEDG
jgi:uncharacterized protein YybS (DUF2232 family)